MAFDYAAEVFPVYRQSVADSSPRRSVGGRPLRLGILDIMFCDIDLIIESEEVGLYL